MLTAASTESVTLPKPSANHSSDHATVARAAAMRAESIRHQLARRDALAPLRSAWLRRAAELELASTVLWPESPSNGLQRSA